VTVNLAHFSKPPSEREVLRYALKNILSDYADQHDELPFNADDPDLDTLTDHRINFGGNYSQLVARLDNRFDGTSFEVNSDDHLDIEDLQGIFTNSTASYPLVEVHPELYEYQAQKDESPETYVIQRGHHGETLVPYSSRLALRKSLCFITIRSSITMPTRMLPLRRSPEGCSSSSGADATLQVGRFGSIRDNSAH